MGSLDGWIAIACLAVGSFVIRYSFIGLLSDRTLPPGVAQTIRLAVPAILAALVVPLIVMSGNGLASRTPHLLAALVAGVIAYRRGGMFVPMVAGFVTLYGLRALIA